MITFKLFGSLGREFGESFVLHVKSFAEGIRAIDTMFAKKLTRHLIEKDKDGICYRVLINGRDFIDKNELQGPLPIDGEINVIPVIQGAGGEWWQQVLIGVAIIAVAYFAPGLGTTLTGILYSAGVAIAIGGIARLISPSPDMDPGNNDSTLPSSTFSGVRNTAQQGLPVPVAYGDVMIGSNLISVGLENSDAPLRPE